MKKIIHFLAVLNILAFVFCSSSLSADFGVFLEGSSGSGEFEWDTDTISYDMDTKTGSFGFVLDTATTNESGFNYRLNIGLSSLTIEDPNSSGEYDTRGIYAENIFGFALMKRETFRWWLGPLLRIGYYSGDDYDVDMSFFEFGLGLVSGMNFKLGNVILAPSIGVRWNGYAGIGEDKYSSYEEDFTANSTTGFLNLAMLF